MIKFPFQKPFSKIVLLSNRIMTDLLVDLPKFVYHLRKKIEKEKDLIATALVDGRVSKEDYDI